MKAVFGLALGVGLAATAAAGALAQTCPKRPDKEASTRIIGGANADVRNWPGMTALRLRLPDGQPFKTLYMCGGTLIDKNWVVTAAHCVSYGASASPFFKRAAPTSWTVASAGEVPVASDGGDFKYVQIEGGELEIVIGPQDLKKVTGQVLKAADIIVHPGFSGGDSPVDDIALIRLSAPAIGPVMAMSVASDTDPEGANDGNMWVAGFGMIGNGFEKGKNTEKNTGHVNGLFAAWSDPKSGATAAGSDLLQEVRLPFRPVDQCGLNDARKGKQLCAGVVEQDARKRKDSCNGDSGGPIVRTGPDGCPILVGLVSYGPYKCAKEDSWSVYTQVSGYADWIRQNAKGSTIVAGKPGVGQEAIAELINAMRYGKQNGIRGLAFSERPGTASPGVSITLASGPKAKIGTSTVATVTSYGVAGYLAVVDADAKGNLSYVLPNSFAPEPMTIAAGQTVTIGAPGGAFKYGIGPPKGRSRVYAIVSPDKAMFERMKLSTRSARGVVVEAGGTQAAAVADTAATTFARAANSDKPVLGFGVFEYEVVE